MKKKSIVLLAVAVVCLSFQSYAFAEYVSGTVSSIDVENGVLEINTADYESGEQKTEKITLSDETTLTGIETVSELKVGDSVSLNTVDGEAGTGLKATSLRIRKS